MAIAREICSRSTLTVFFFFQAEDGIRDYKVTGVQTCALPILHGDVRDPSRRSEPRGGRPDPALGGEGRGNGEERLRADARHLHRQGTADRRDRKSVV